MEHRGREGGRKGWHGVASLSPPPTQPSGARHLRPICPRGATPRRLVLPLAGYFRCPLPMAANGSAELSPFGHLFPDLWNCCHSLARCSDDQLAAASAAAAALSLFACPSLPPPPQPHSALLSQFSSAQLLFSAQRRRSALLAIPATPPPPPMPPPLLPAACSPRRRRRG